MAISKKSLGKVLAISMASAMAMSSLSAALVNVAAVQDPALASNGSVDYTDGRGQNDICSLFDLRDIDDDTVEVIGGGVTNLNALTEKLKQQDVFTYTDADDLEKFVEKVSVDYKVTSGSSYLRYYSKDGNDNKAGDLIAQNKSGSATLQIKISGEVDLGGGKGTKKVSFTQDIHFDVHEKDSIGLEVFRGDDKPVYDTDLDKLAAYGESLSFVLVKYTPAADGFLATFTNLQSGAAINPDDPTPPGPGPDTNPVDDVIKADNLDKAGLANDANAQEAFKALLAADNNGKVTVADAAKIPAGLKTLVDEGKIKATDVLIKEVKDANGNVTSPAVTVQDVLNDTAGTGAAKTLADALANAVKNAGLNPDTPTPPVTTSTEDAQRKALAQLVTAQLSAKGVDQANIDAFVAKLNGTRTETTNADGSTTVTYSGGLVTFADDTLTLPAEAWTQLTTSEADKTIQPGIPADQNFYKDADDEVKTVRDAFLAQKDAKGNAVAYQVTTPAPAAQADSAVDTLTQYFVNYTFARQNAANQKILLGDQPIYLADMATQNLKYLLTSAQNTQILEGDKIAGIKLTISNKTTAARVAEAYAAANAENAPAATKKAWENIVQVTEGEETSYYYIGGDRILPTVKALNDSTVGASPNESQQLAAIVKGIQDKLTTDPTLSGEGAIVSGTLETDVLALLDWTADTENPQTGSYAVKPTVNAAALEAVALTQAQSYTAEEALAVLENNPGLKATEPAGGSNGTSPIYTITEHNATGDGLVTKYYTKDTYEVKYGQDTDSTTAGVQPGILLKADASVTTDTFEIVQTDNGGVYRAFQDDSGNEDFIAVDDTQATGWLSADGVNGTGGNEEKDSKKWKVYYKNAAKLVEKDSSTTEAKLKSFLDEVKADTAGNTDSHIDTLAKAGVVKADGNYYLLNGYDKTNTVVDDSYATSDSNVQNPTKLSDIFTLSGTQNAIDTASIIVEDWDTGACLLETTGTVTAGKNFKVLADTQSVSELKFVTPTGASTDAIKVAARNLGEFFYVGTTPGNALYSLNELLEDVSMTPTTGTETFAFSAFEQTTKADGTKEDVTKDLVKKSGDTGYTPLGEGEDVVRAAEMKFQNVSKGVAVDAINVDTVFTNGTTEEGKADLAALLAQAKTEAGVTTPTNPDPGTTTPETPAENQPAAQADDDKPLPSGTAKAETVRFYSGAGQEMFEVGNGSEGTNTEWKRSTKTDKKAEENSIYKTADGTLVLNTKGNTGASTVKVAYSYMEGEKEIVKELTKNVKVVKAADFGGQSITIDKTGSKTIVDDGGQLDSVKDKNLSGFEIRTDGSVTMKNGSIGNITRAGSVSVQGGKAGNIDIAGDVTVAEDGVVGDITDAGKVTIEEGGEAGAITSGSEFILNEGKVKSIDIEGKVTILGGIVTGDVRANGTIEITSNETDTNNHALDTEIGGNVTLLARAVDRADNFADGITINNESEDGGATLKIGGNVVAKHVDTGLNTENESPTLIVGDTETTGLIQIAGVIEGEKIQLGGNGLVSLGSVRGASEVKHLDDDGQIVDSALTFEGFNSAIDSITNFADVKITEGTVTVNNELKANNLTVSSNAQLVANKIDIEDDILESGSIVVPAGNLVVTGNVDDTPSLALMGDVTENTLAYVGNRGLVDAFDMGGITLRAERQTNGDYNYVVASANLSGLTAVGKDVAIGEKQDKAVSVVLDGALPEGASIVWESDDRDIATVSGEGNKATISGVKVGSTSIKAMVVDANGRDLGYTDAIFDITVLDHATVDAIGSALALDTKAVGMDVGQSYSFLVRENSDTDNITLSYDSNIVDVALAQADYNGRGALYTITAKANGSTNVTVNYKGASSSVAVKVGGFKLDTAKKDLAPGQTYSFLAKNVPADQAANVKLEYDANVATVALAQADYNGRGALFTVTGNQVGSTEIKATYNNEEAIMAVNVVEYTGRMTLDTASYTMPFGGTYTIGVKIEQNGRQLSGEEVNAMIARGELRVRDSRTGTIINAPQVLANGNVRVTGKSTEGTTYVLFEVIQNGQVVTHASVGVTVQAGATAGGSSRRSISQW